MSLFPMPKDSSVAALVALCKKIGALCDALTKELNSRRFIRLRVAAVTFKQPTNESNPMSENIGVDVPAGKIARIVFAPVNEKQERTKLDGPLTATVLEDADAEVAVGGPDGLTVDIQLPAAEGSLATVEVDGDADTDPAKRQVLTTIITARRLGDVPGKAVSLGGTAENVSFPAGDQFGVFDAASSQAKKQHH